jgi:hypothetical protein
MRVKVYSAACEGVEVRIVERELNNENLKRKSKEKHVGISLHDSV